jgi:activator of HSP90 ATPase
MILRSNSTHNWPKKKALTLIWGKALDRLERVLESPTTQSGTNEQPQEQSITHPMPVTFRQSIEFKGVGPNELFDIYLNSEKHSAALGSSAWIEPKVGGRFKIFGEDAVRGSNLAIVPHRLIVQTWRGAVWQDTDLDSVLILTFSKTAKGARIDLVQANVPEKAISMVNRQAWTKMYWKPWQAYLRGHSTAKKRK